MTGRSQLRARWLATARGIRGWRAANARRATPCCSAPRYSRLRRTAADDDHRSRARTLAVLIRILADGIRLRCAHRRIGSPHRKVFRPHAGPGALAAASTSQATRRQGASPHDFADAVRADLSRARGNIAPELPDELMLAGITGWVQLFGMVSRFELSGQFNNVIEARAEFFGLQMEIMADLIGLGKSKLGRTRPPPLAPMPLIVITAVIWFQDGPRWSSRQGTTQGRAARDPAERSPCRGLSQHPCLCRLSTRAAHKSRILRAREPVHSSEWGSRQRGCHGDPREKGGKMRRFFTVRRSPSPARRFSWGSRGKRPGIPSPGWLTIRQIGSGYSHFADPTRSRSGASS